MSDFHWLRLDMTAGSGSEPAWTEGETRAIPRGRIKLCERGYHSSPTLFDGLQYAPGPIACLVEVSEPVARDATKQVSRSRTLLGAVDVTRELRLFAADCAEHVLHVYESQFPGDVRPRNAIATARAFANGEATLKELRAAADAAFAAATATATAYATNATNAAAAAAYAAADAATSASAADADAVYAATAADAATNAAYAATAVYATNAAAATERQWQRARFDEIVLPSLMARVTQ